MFKSLHKFGFGNAKVDLRFHCEAVLQGSILGGDVLIVGAGGYESTTFVELSLCVVTEYLKMRSNHQEIEICILAEHKLFDRFTIHPSEEIPIPFAIQLPIETPVSMGRSRVTLQTKHKKKQFVSLGNAYPIQISPNPFTDKVLNTIKSFGFSLDNVNCKYTNKFSKCFPFVQGFEFRPTGEFRRLLDELAVYLRPNPNGIEVILQIDKRDTFREFFGKDENYASVQLNMTDLQNPNFGMNLRKLIAQQIYG